MRIEDEKKNNRNYKGKVMGRVKDFDFNIGSFGGGITFYPYQLSLGFSLRYWPCLYAPTIRIHIGPIKLWVYLRLKRTVVARGRPVIK